MTDQSILNNQEVPTEASQEQPSTEASSQQPSPSSTDDLDTLLDSIKNEKGERKYKDVRTALEALGHSQSYISDLKGQLSERETLLSQAQTDLEKSKTMDEFVQQLQSSQPKEPEASPQAASGLTQEDIQRLFQENLQQHQAQQTAQSNLQRVKDTLNKTFGNDADSKITETAKRYGMSVEDLSSLAAKSPDAVLAWFQSSNSSSPSMGSSLNTAALSGQPKEHVLEKPTKSMMRGASTKDLTDYWKQIAEHVNKTYS